jgi:hypothetical protein
LATCPETYVAIPALSCFWHLPVILSVKKLPSPLFSSAMASLTWLQEHPRIQAHLPKELHERVLQLQQAMGIATLSQVLVQILERFFAGEDVGDLLLEDTAFTSESVPPAAATREPEPTPEDQTNSLVDQVQKRALGVFAQLKLTGQAIARSTLENLQKEVPELTPATDPPALFAALFSAVALPKPQPTTETAPGPDLTAPTWIDDPWVSPSADSPSPLAEVIAPPWYGQPASGVDAVNAREHLGSRSLPPMLPIAPGAAPALPPSPTYLCLPPGFGLSPGDLADLKQTLDELCENYPALTIVDPACGSSAVLLAVMQITQDTPVIWQGTMHCGQDPQPPKKTPQQ